MSDPQLEALIDRLRSHGICYFAGGSGEYDGPPAPLGPLLLDLARSNSSRLRWAPIALFLRHPEHVAVAQVTARGLPPADPARRVLLVSILVAAALQYEWGFTLDLYLPQRARLTVDGLVAELGVPVPSLDYGRSCLRALAQQERGDAGFPANYEADWENVYHRLHAQLVGEARASGT